MSLPPLPERRWAAFCSKCYHSEQIPKPTEKAVICSRCGYCCFAEEQDYTADQLRAAQREMAEECAKLLSSMQDHEIAGAAHYAGSWHSANEWHMVRQAILGAAIAAIRAKFCK